MDTLRSGGGRHGAKVLVASGLMRNASLSVIETVPTPFVSRSTKY
jgi:hypothetical protein